MRPTGYKIEAKKVQLPKGWDLTTQLYRECKLNSRKSEGGKYVSALVHTDNERQKLRRFLNKYKYDKDLLFELFDKEHLEMKAEESVKYNGKNIITEEYMEGQDKISAEAWEEFGERVLQSVAKVIGVVYNREFADQEDLDLDAFYEALSSEWDDIIDEFDKANEAEADDAGDEDVLYEIDECLSDKSVTLEDLGIVDADSLKDAILMLADEKDIAESLKDADDDEDDDDKEKEVEVDNSIWADDTRLDDNDALKSFDDLVKKLDDAEDAEAVADAEETEDVEESENNIVESANESAKSEDFIDRAINEGYEFVKIEDMMNEQYEAGRRAAMNESGKEIEIKKKGETQKLNIETAAPKSTKKNPISAAEFKSCKSKAIANAKAIVRDDSAKLVRAAINGLKAGASAVEIEKAIEEVNKAAKFAVKADLIKVLNVALTCAKSLVVESAGASVTANFAKYRKMFESEEDKKQEEQPEEQPEDQSNGNDQDNSQSDDQKPADNGAAKETEEPEDEEGDSVIVTIKKKEGAEVDDIFEQFKKDLIDCGVEEGDIERVEEEKKDDNNDGENSDNNEEEKKDEEIKVRIDGNSIAALLEFGKKHNIDIEKLAGCEFDVEDDEEGEDKDKDDKSGDDKSNDSSVSDETPDDGGISDDMWASIFGDDSSDDNSSNDKK